MTANRGPGVAVNAGVGTTTLEHRLQLAGQYAENAPGVPRSGVLAQATALLVTGKATMAYDIAPCPLVINRTASEGVYTPTLTGTTTVATTAAPASGSRWDLVWVKQNDVAKGDADNLAITGVTQGASGASPTKPYASIPAGAYVLAEAQIFATTTGTVGGSNTITQVWRYTVTRGAPIPVRNQAERDELTPSVTQQVRRLDLIGLPIETYDGTKWFTDPTPRRKFVVGTATGSLPTASGWIPIAADYTVPANPFGVGVPYEIEVNAQAAPVAGAGGAVAIRTLFNAASGDGGQAQSPTSSTGTLPLQGSKYVSDGSAVTVSVQITALTSQATLNGGSNIYWYKVLVRPATNL